MVTRCFSGAMIGAALTLGGAGPLGEGVPLSPAQRTDMLAMLRATDVRMLAVPDRGGNAFKRAALETQARAHGGAPMPAATRLRLVPLVENALSGLPPPHAAPFQIDRAVAFVAGDKAMLLLICDVCGYGTLTLAGTGNDDAPPSLRLDTRDILPLVIMP